MFVVWETVIDTEVCVRGRRETEGKVYCVIFSKFYVYKLHFVTFLPKYRS